VDDRIADVTMGVDTLGIDVCAEVSSMSAAVATCDDERWPEPAPLLALAFQFDFSGPSSAQMNKINAVASVKLANAGCARPLVVTGRARRRQSSAVMSSALPP